MIDQSYSLILPEDQPPRRVEAIKTALCVSEERAARGGLNDETRAILQCL